MNKDYTNLKTSLVALLVLVVCLITFSIYFYIETIELNNKNIKLSKQVSLLIDKTDELYTKYEKLELNNENTKKEIKFIKADVNDYSIRITDLKKVHDLTLDNFSQIQKLYNLVLSLRFFHFKYDRQKLNISDTEYIDNFDSDKIIIQLM